MKSNNQPRLTPEILEMSQKQKKDMQRKYYETHKNKINESRKILYAKEQAKICEEKGIPVVLAPYIVFREPSKYKTHPTSLHFDSISDMLLFLADFKFKTDINKEELLKLREKFIEEEEEAMRINRKMMNNSKSVFDINK